MQPSWMAPWPAWGTTTVRLFGIARRASRTFASGSCGSLPPTIRRTGTSVRTRDFDHPGCGALGHTEQTADARPASSAVRSARYVPLLAARVRARLQRAHGSLQTIDQNISCGQTLTGQLTISDCQNLDGTVADFWLFDGRLVHWNHFSGDGASGGGELTDDRAAIKLCADAFEAVWERATPHDQYDIK